MYILTGGAGFIGSAFLSRLNREGIDDVVVVDSLGSSEKWKNLRNKSYSDYYHKDEFLALFLGGKLPFPVKEIKAIIHMGACSSTAERDLDYLLKNNYYYTRHLAEFAVAQNIRFIYASSGATYGDGSAGYDDSDECVPKLLPLNGYGYSKQIFDRWLIGKEWQSKVAGLKFFNVYGPNEYHKGEMRSVVHKSFGQIKERGEVALFKSYRSDYRDGEQLRDFVYVMDCVEVMWWLLRNPAVNGIFNVGSGSARSWNELVRAVFSAMEREPRIRYIEMPEDLRKHYQYFTEAKITKLQKAGCPVRFRSLEDGVNNYVREHLVREVPYL